MPAASKRLYKTGLGSAALLLLLAVAWCQSSLNRQRSAPGMELAYATDLGTNAPPMLAFTTVALGAFRGLIANVLWVRANDLQQDGKYFEMVQLADWITKLEPHFVQVWLVQAWNMAYNISVKFSNPSDRWRWVQSGIALLRDQGLRYNPREALVYRELSWFFQHKMGQNLDDAHVFYKLSWATNMTEVFGGPRPDFATLIHPQTDDQRRRAAELRQVYKLDPELMRAVDEKYGPLEWRLPEAHAVYWAWLGLRESKPKDLMTLRRSIYQSMQQSVFQGRLTQVASDLPPRFNPDLSLADKANATFLEVMQQEPAMRGAIETAHRHFLRQLIFVLYTNNRTRQAAQYFDLLRQRYPADVPPDRTVDDYAFDYLNANVATLNQSKTRAVIEGLLQQSFLSRALGEDDRADGFYLMARRLWNLYDQRTARQNTRLGIQSLNELAQPILQAMLDPQTGLHPELAARLRASLARPEPAPPQQ